jgi:hypothetical protein
MTPDERRALDTRLAILAAKARLESEAWAEYLRTKRRPYPVRLRASAKAVVLQTFRDIWNGMTAGLRDGRVWVAITLMIGLANLILLTAGK